MTAIYSYISQEHKTGFIAADDIELNTGKRVDKIVLVANRFAIGVHGKTSVIRALETIASFQQYNNVEKINSLEQLLCSTWQLTKVICDFQYKERLKAKENGDLSEKDWADFIASSATLVILDCRDLCLFEVEQKALFPPDKIDDHAEMRQKSYDKLHLASFASIAARRDWEELNLSDIQNPFKFAKKRFETDRARVSNIGGLGTIVVINNEKLLYHSAFNSPLKYLLNELQLNHNGNKSA